MTRYRSRDGGPGARDASTQNGAISHQPQAQLRTALDDLERQLQAALGGSRHPETPGAPLAAPELWPDVVGNEEPILISPAAARQVEAQYVLLGQRTLDVWRLYDRCLEAGCLFDPYRELCSRHLSAIGNAINDELHWLDQFLWYYQRFSPPATATGTKGKAERAC